MTIRLDRLDDFERRIAEAVQARDARMREELAAMVAIPTGFNHTPGLDALRDLLAETWPESGKIYLRDGKAPAPGTLMRNEGLAATYARLTGKVGVCLATLGPGATNLVTGVAYAQLGGMPMLAITGQKGIRENWQADFQIIDVVNMMKPLTKRTIRSRDPTQLRRRSARPSSWPRPSGSAPATLSCPRMWRGRRRIRRCGH